MGNKEKRINFENFNLENYSPKSKEIYQMVLGYNNRLGINKLIESIPENDKDSWSEFLKIHDTYFPVNSNFFNQVKYSVMELHYQEEIKEGFSKMDSEGIRVLPKVKDSEKIEVE